MLTFVIVIHVLVSVLMIALVLLQPGNQGGVSAALGGAGGQTVFGGQGANTFLAKLTAACAIAFMVTNFALVYFSSQKGSAFDSEEWKETPAATAAPEGAPEGTAATVETGAAGEEPATSAEPATTENASAPAAVPAPAAAPAVPADGQPGSKAEDAASPTPAKEPAKSDKAAEPVPGK